MKKVRFESPKKGDNNFTMEQRECHSPRPFMSKKSDSEYVNLCYTYPRIAPITTDPIQRYDYSDSLPYLKSKPQTLNQASPQCTPSSDLELSMFDSSTCRKPGYDAVTFGNNNNQYYLNKIYHSPENMGLDAVINTTTSSNTLKSIENCKQNGAPKIICKENAFFIKPGTSIDLLQQNSLANVINTKANVLRSKQKHTTKPLDNARIIRDNSLPDKERVCGCHHCEPNDKENITKLVPTLNGTQKLSFSCFPHIAQVSDILSCGCTLPTQTYHCKNQCNCEVITHPVCYSKRKCNCTISKLHSPLKHQNAVDKKTLAIEKYEKSKKNEPEGQIDIAKRECEPKCDTPTVSDLFQIIKIQNEQLKLLQEKVDKFISKENAPSQNITPPPSLENYRSQQVALETLHDNHHKISIGVMTSFEMVRTSTFINKEFSKHQNAQVQCNTSQLSIKETVAKSTSVTQQNFLEGLTPLSNNGFARNVTAECENFKDTKAGDSQRLNSKFDNQEKTVNDLSLCNLQIDNAITPQMSPDQTIYLDVRDYSDSDDDNTNVGWTYYNKVMTHVNGMLQDSDMPSSASAMHRNAAKRVQMQFDKSNVSITKRVTFGDEPLKINQPHFNAAQSTDTSMKMNQLAAKYLKQASPVPQMLQQGQYIPNLYPNVDMSFATRNYMEKHQLLQGLGDTVTRAPPNAMPRFLDITALKQQPKLL